MDSVRIDVAGDRQVGLRFDNFPDELRADLLGEIDALSNELFSRVLGATPELTGKLLGQERLRLFNDEERITGYVDIAGDGKNDYEKAAALEYGSRGGSVAIQPRASRMEALLAGPAAAMAKAYSRTPDVPEFRFLRGPLDAMRPEVSSRLNAVVTRAVEAANR